MQDALRRLNRTTVKAAPNLRKLFGRRFENQEICGFLVHKKFRANESFNDADADWKTVVSRVQRENFSKLTNWT